MSLATNVNNLATRVATECKSIRTLINGNAADLSALTTTAKTNLVAAINEVKASVAAAAGISDGTTSTSSTWSSTKITSYVGTSTAGLINDTTPSTSSVFSSTKTNTAISAAVAALVNSAPTALDTLKELSDALGGDASFAATTATALGNRVRHDTAAQGLTGTQQGNARTNILAAGQAAFDTLVANVGDTTTDFTATFVAGLV